MFSPITHGPAAGRLTIFYIYPAPENIETLCYFETLGVLLFSKVFRWSEVQSTLHRRSDLQIDGVQSIAPVVPANHSPLQKYAVFIVPLLSARRYFSFCSDSIHRLTRGLSTVHKTAVHRALKIGRGPGAILTSTVRSEAAYRMVIAHRRSPTVNQDMARSLKHLRRRFDLQIDGPQFIALIPPLWIFASAPGCRSLRDRRLRFKLLFALLWPPLNRSRPLDDAIQRPCFLDVPSEAVNLHMHRFYNICSFFAGFNGFFCYVWRNFRSRGWRSSRLWSIKENHLQISNSRFISDSWGIDAISPLHSPAHQQKTQ